ncbi:MAG TPA: ATP-binding protein [Blastocatellia bacterium]|jgi:signal transduction histidine kinase/ActR/RegA family two-component response regulator|nr:ATP-binding protein [Blastocatellia bacterium]
MRRHRRSLLFNYGIAILIVAVSLSLVLLLRVAVPFSTAFIIVGALVASGWYGGVGPGILSAALWYFLSNQFLRPTPHSIFAVHLNDGDIFRIVLVMLIAALAGGLRRASLNRKARAYQQEVIARLGQTALEGADPTALMNETMRLIVETLDVKHCAVLKFIPEENVFLVIAGAGWKDGIVGQRTVPSGTDSMAGYTLGASEPVLVKDVRSESRFRIHPDVKEHGIASSMAVIIHGPVNPFGVLVIHATQKSRFTKDDLNFARAVANVLSAAIERKRGEEDLQKQHNWLENVLNLMPTPMLLVESNTDKVTFANKAANEMAGGNFPKGLASEEYHAAYYYTDAEGNRVPDDKRPGVRAAAGERLAGVELEWHTPVGRRSVIIFSDMLPAMHGHAATAVLVFHDITHLKQIESELQESSRLKDEFLATVSHELRTPLNAILGWATMLRAGQLEEDVSNRALETIERNAKLQAQIIDDLLDVSRIITGKLRLNVQAVDLAPAIEGAIEAIRPAANAKGIRLQTVLDRGLGPILGDPDRFQQIMWNLLSNAIKFTPRGGRVQVSLVRVNSHVEVSVSDTGQGINPDFLPYVFDRFRQADSTLTRAFGGLGLGLSIVRHLVELHGGTVSVFSEGEGKGATFKIDLPLWVTQDMDLYKPDEKRDPEPRATPGLDTITAPSLDDLSILLVDDDADTRELLSRILKMFGARVTVVASASEAVTAIQDIKPDILVSDIGMPEEDGYSLIRKVRAAEVGVPGWMPAVALTAHARAEDRLRALSAGYQAHVTKPVEPAELATVIRSLIRRNGGPS